MCNIFSRVVARCLCAPRTGSRMRSDRLSPWTRFRFCEHRLFYTASATGGRVYCPCFPRNHSSSSALASVGWHLDPLLSQLAFMLAFMFLLFFLSPFGTGSVVPTGVVETPGGRALDTPVQWTSRLGIANWHFAAAHDTWPTCDLSTDGAVRANYARFGFRSKCLFPSHVLHCSDSVLSCSGFRSVACQGCVQAERERQRKSA